jgi:hypothetical protein
MTDRARILRDSRRLRRAMESYGRLQVRRYRRFLPAFGHAGVLRRWLRWRIRVDEEKLQGGLCWLGKGPDADLEAPTLSLLRIQIEARVRSERLLFDLLVRHDRLLRRRRRPGARPLEQAFDAFRAVGAWWEDEKGSSRVRSRRLRAALRHAVQAHRSHEAAHRFRRNSVFLDHRRMLAVLRSWGRASAR